jgi:hypothetical protein
MSRSTDQDTDKERKPWTKPELRRIDLTDDEREALRNSDDPMALLLTMKAKLKNKQV